ncbi:hypothetical protein H257_08982 [Aphanomyces astaci]|uniref:Uncharacterized protein n=1 Tax=Aphanomyces astaci TaxID=112090 RepID=W4GBN7_APHAT|nr:hypothetical protein H257_08982 [Aphanomyces astaci]ETV77082.1 hypothetical protein H257_08982 [Aphanomyces astaci]|eukprot:XP_009833388.1 hypothetical protein H257_08982 [Aphanomyces astaci]
MFKARLVQRLQTTRGPLRLPNDVDLTSPGCSRCRRSGGSTEDSSKTSGSLRYQYVVAHPSWKRLRAVVGGRRVPFFDSQLQHIRHRRNRLFLDNGLSPIVEEMMYECEACHSNAFSSLEHTKHITLTRSKGNVQLHLRWATKPQCAALVC